MWLKKVHVYLLILSFGALNVVAKASINSKKFGLNAPQKLTNCKAKLDDGSVVDLTSQDKASSPR